MLSTHAQKLRTPGFIGAAEHIACMPDKDRYLKWLTKIPKEAENTWKHTCEKGQVMPLHNEKVGVLSELAQKADSLQLAVLQTPEDVDWCKVKRLILPKPLTIDANA